MTSSSWEAAPRVSTARLRSLRADCALPSSSGSWWAASARTRHAFRRSRCCAQTRPCTAHARLRPRPTSTSRPHSHGVTTWSPTTPMPVGRSGWRTMASICFAGPGAWPGRAWPRSTVSGTPPSTSSWPPDRGRAPGPRSPVPGPRSSRARGRMGTREATSMTAVPRRLLVLGGGSAGLELAQVVRRFGGEVVRWWSSKAPTAAGGDRPAPARRGDRARDGRRRGRPPRHPCRGVHARRRAAVGDRRRHRHLAAHPRRRRSPSAPTSRSRC
jgi:hypothetical protein